MLDKLIVLKKKILLKKEKMPRHLSLTIGGNIIWSEKHNIPLEEAYKKVFIRIEEFLSLQVNLNIPVMTVFLLSEELRDSENFTIFKELLIKFFNRIKDSKVIHNNMVKVSILGKWYDLPYRLIEPIKNTIDITKDYDNFFLNLCINYDGQEEITDAAKLIARKVKAEKLDPDSITKETIKDNLYSSYFIPADVIIVTGRRKFTAGLLLWDSSRTIIYFSEKVFPEFTSVDFLSGIEYYQKSVK
ncbi:di-trans,poly-cis-decaprenylcistransferase [Candidatus Woesearchaeota archaeon]|nr:di-trans,poly-cis-decaprenylcistransferase [Candidatus Woesearchaeota archaeon]